MRLAVPPLQKRTPHRHGAVRRHRRSGQQFSGLWHDRRHRKNPWACRIQQNQVLAQNVGPTISCVGRQSRCADNHLGTSWCRCFYLAVIPKPRPSTPHRFSGDLLDRFRSTPHRPRNPSAVATNTARIQRTKRAADGGCGGDFGAKITPESRARSVGLRADSGANLRCRSALPATILYIEGRITPSHDHPVGASIS